MIIENFHQQSEILKGYVFNIQRYSIHDGPGIRTIVFLKGCPLNCLWCSNPESQESFPRILHDPGKCMKCSACVSTCSTGAIKLHNDIRLIDAKKCDLCGNCLEVCYSNALELIGREMSVEDVMKEVRKDRTFYYESGGGVTLSGGEPSAQYKFAVKILEQCNEEGIDTALETCGYARWEVLEQLVQNVNLVLYDIKHMDSKEHKSYVGEDNGLILENARKIATLGKKMIIRVPIIPTYNDSIKHIQKLVDFVISLKTVNEIHLLPYHALGKGKYIRLGLKYSLGDLKSPDHYEMEKLKDICINAGLIAHIGG